jgi:hypothetical protein
VTSLRWLVESEKTHMGIITPIEPGAHASSNPQTSCITGALHPTLQRWGYAAALVIGLSALVIIPPDRNAEDVVRLERLAPEIERAHALPLETRESINRLVARQITLVGTGGQSHDIRRKAAIDRVTSAIRAKDSSTGSIADVAIR